MEKDVRITVVIAVRNMADTLSRAIESVLNQTYWNKELIIMDGASTDDTVNVIKKYEDRLAYWISAPDKGPSDAISKALPHSTGELIGFLGADDWYEPYALEQVAKAYRTTQADLYYGNMMTRNGEESELKDLEKFSPDKLFMEGTQWLGAVCAYADKNLLAENYKKKNEVLLTDYLFFLRLYADGRRFAHIGEKRHITNFSIGGRTTEGIYRALRDTEVVRKQFLEEYPAMKAKYAKCEEQMKKAYIMGIVQYYKDVFNVEKYKKYIKDLPCSGEGCILFGSGKMGVACAKLMMALDIHIECFVDNSSNKWGQTVEGIKVVDPQVLKGIEGKWIIVTPTGEYEEQIVKQLHEMQVDKTCKIINYSDIAMQAYEALGEDALDEAWKNGLIS